MLALVMTLSMASCASEKTGDTAKSDDPAWMAAIDAVDFFDEERESKTHQIVCELPVTAENLSKAIPTAETLAGYVGKKGSEIQDLGFSLHGWYFEDKMIYAEKGLFEYIIRFDNDIQYKEDMSDDEVWDELKDNTVQSVEYYGLGMDSDNLEYHD